MIEPNSVIHADCLSVMRGIEDKSIDLVLTDPPYGINNAKNNKSRGKLAIPKDYGKCEWDIQIPNKQYFDEMLRISKNQIIFGGNYFIEYLKNSPCWLVWDKDNGKSDFADCELIYTSYNSAVRKYRHKWNGMLQENMGKYKEKRYHPTQKPYQLIERILQDYSKEGDIVFDPFAGSGTTAVACIKTGRKYICIEKEERYVDIIHKRIEQAEESVSLLNIIDKSL